MGRPSAPTQPSRVLGSLRARRATRRWFTRGAVPFLGGAWGGGGSAGSGDPCTGGEPSHSRAGQTITRSTSTHTFTRQGDTLIQRSPNGPTPPGKPPGPVHNSPPPP